MMRRINNDGTFGWGGGIHNLCNAEGTQANMTVRRSGSTYYAAWADARPGVSPGWYDIYLQKFDTAGTFHWAPNGIEAASYNTYDPIPRMTLDAEGNIIFAFQSNVTGYIGQKVAPDGTLPWGPEARLITNTTLMPAQFDHTVIVSGDNAIAAWASSFGNASDIYITRVDEVLHASVPESRPGNLVIYPNPARNLVEVTLEKSVQAGSVNLYNANGQLIESKRISANASEEKIVFNVSDLPAGMYFVNLTSGEHQTGKKLLVR
jgi:hypothetical protein